MPTPSSSLNIAGGNEDAPGTGVLATGGQRINTTGTPVDGEMDTLADGWELENGLDPADDGSIDINNGPDGDPDMDLSLNGEEQESV